MIKKPKREKPADFPPPPEVIAEFKQSLEEYMDGWYEAAVKYFRERGELPPEEPEDGAE
jgi:hypothetical protein